jgi:hypothetical protein
LTGKGENKMPYIKQDDREALDNCIEQFRLMTVGELNYTITNILMRQHPQTYADFNALIGVLECAKLELYRRACAPYEDKKILENGDVNGYMENK